MPITQITSAAGLRAGRVFLLDSAGYPDGDQAGANGYDGTDITGIKSVAITAAEVQRIQHRGNDRVFAQDYLPPNELPSGSITTGKSNQTLDALLTDTTVATLGEAAMDVQATDKQGGEKDIAVIYWRQALDTDPDATTTAGLRRWQTYIIPKTRMIPTMGGGDQGADDVNAYSLVPTAVTTAPWGVAFTENDNGATEAVRLRFTAEYPLFMERFNGNATLTEFTLTHTPVTAAKTYARANGSAVTVSSVNTSTKTFTASIAPANAAKVIVLYETSDALA